MKILFSTAIYCLLLVTCSLEFMPALYRIHRPQTWEALIGQETIRETLQNEIRTGRIAHAYLFSGPRGIGKTTAARLLAKTVNCIGRKEGDAEPDNSCEACVAIQENKALDLIELDAATHTGVDMVREHIIENASVSPMQLKYKVFIIDEVHRLSGSAFDALLKTLEEPPEHAIFILATTESHKLPATILSRCQRFTFNFIAPEIMRARLQDICKKEKAQVDDEILNQLIARSGGCMRDAESLLDQLLALGDKIDSEQASLILPPSSVTDAYPFVLSILDGKTQEAIDALQKLTDKGVSLEAFNKAIIEILRALLVSKCVPEMEFPYLEGFEQNKEKLDGHAFSNSIQELQKVLEAFLESLPALKYSSVPQLPLELAVISLHHRNTATPRYEDNKTTKQKSNNNEPEPNQKAGGTTLSRGFQIETKTKDDKKTNQLTSQPVNQPTKPRIALSEEEASTIWNKTLLNIQKNNPSLGLILKTAEIYPSQDDRFIIKVEFPFHQDQINKNGGKNLIEKQLCDITGHQWKLECGIQEPAEKESMAEEVAAAFDGTVID